MGDLLLFPRVLKFRDVADAIGWYRAHGGRDPLETAPPVDMTGDPGNDMFLSVLFGDLVERATASEQLDHLFLVAGQQGAVVQALHDEASEGDGRDALHRHSELLAIIVRWFDRVDQAGSSSGGAA